MKLSQQLVEMAEWWVTDNVVESANLYHRGTYNLASKVIFDDGHYYTFTTSIEREEYFNNCRAFLCLLEAELALEEEITEELKIARDWDEAFL